MLVHSEVVCGVVKEEGDRWTTRLSEELKTLLSCFLYALVEWIEGLRHWELERDDVTR